LSFACDGLADAAIRCDSTARPDRGAAPVGFIGPFAGGKHEYMQKGVRILTIPNPHRDDIGPKLLALL